MTEGAKLDRQAQRSLQGIRLIGAGSFDSAAFSLSARDYWVYGAR